MPVVHEITNISCSISWTPCLDNGGCKLIGYYIFRTVAGSSRMTKINYDPVASTSFTDETLETGGQYQYRVAAVNKMGTGPPSALSKPFVASNRTGLYIFLFFFLLA